MMFSITVGGRTITNVVGMEMLPRHGFSSIVKSITGAVKYEGYYKDQYFVMEYVHDYGMDSWDMLAGTVQDEDILIDWIENGDHSEDTVFQRYVASER